jgi:hypothetical protein
MLFKDNISSFKNKHESMNCKKPKFRNFVIKTCLIFGFCVVVFSPQSIFAETMSSENYSIISDSLNFGGDIEAGSTNYQLQDVLGEIALNGSDSANYAMNSGFIETIASAVSVTDDDEEEDGEEEETPITVSGGGGIFLQFDSVDFNRDKKINILDFNILMSNWGIVSAGHIQQYDLNKDNVVDIFDCNVLFIRWTA